jgi:hypothetical protein
MIVLALLSAPAMAGDWLPLAIGNRWEYRGTAGNHQVETIIGTTTVRGRVVAVKRYAEGANAGLENYWLLDPGTGSVMLAGFNNPTAGIAIAYEPPLTYLQAPPVVGTPFVPRFAFMHDLFTDADLGVIQYLFTVLQNVVLTLPAGSFDTFGVGAETPVPRPSLAARATLALDGRVLTGALAGSPDDGTTDWFSEGTGVVQYKGDDLYQLVGFGNPTPTAAATWGALKARFH